MQKRANVRRRRRRSGGNFRKVMSVIFSVLFPPVGIFLVWKSRWSNTARYCLTGLAVAVAVLFVALMPSPDARVNGGIELVEADPKAFVYGPDMPTAMVTGYAAPRTSSVIFSATEDPTILYVYASPSDKIYHLESCNNRVNGDQRLTVYEAHFHRYSRCEFCNPPAYITGSVY